MALALLLPAAASAEKPPTYFGERYEEGLAAARSYGSSYYEGILVTGTPAFVERVRAALALIESTDGRSWYFTRKLVRRITLNGHAGMDVGGGRITAGDMTSEGPEAFAGRIVHEAWHGELALGGDVSSAEEVEAFCLARQNDFLVRAGFPGIDVARTLASRYWEKHYWSRDWLAPASLPLQHFDLLKKALQFRAQLVARLGAGHGQVQIDPRPRLHPMRPDVGTDAIGHANVVEDSLPAGEPSERQLPGQVLLTLF